MNKLNESGSAVYTRVLYLFIKTKWSEEMPINFSYLFLYNNLQHSNLINLSYYITKLLRPSLTTFFVAFFFTTNLWNYWKVENETQISSTVHDNVRLFKNSSKFENSINH